MRTKDECDEDRRDREANLGKAREMYSRALSIRENKLPPLDARTAATMHNLGSVYKELKCATNWRLSLKASRMLIGDPLALLQGLPPGTGTAESGAGHPIR